MTEGRTGKIPWPLEIRIASNSAGAPLCVGGIDADGQATDGGFGLDIYYRTSGDVTEVIGVVVSESGEVVQELGWLPAEDRL